MKQHSIQLKVTTDRSQMNDETYVAVPTSTLAFISGPAGSFVPDAIYMDIDLNVKGLFGQLQHHLQQHGSLVDVLDVHIDQSASGQLLNLTLVLTFSS